MLKYKASAFRSLLYPGKLVDSPKSDHTQHFEVLMTRGAGPSPVNTETVFYLPGGRFYFKGDTLIHEDAVSQLAIPKEYQYIKTYCIADAQQKNSVGVRFCTSTGKELDMGSIEEYKASSKKDFIQHATQGTAPVSSDKKYLEGHPQPLLNVEKSLHARRAEFNDCAHEGTIFAFKPFTQYSSKEKLAVMYAVKNGVAQTDKTYGYLSPDMALFRVADGKISLEYHSLPPDTAPSGQHIQSFSVPLKTLFDGQDMSEAIEETLLKHPAYLVINDRKYTVSDRLEGLGEKLEPANIVSDTETVTTLLKQINLLPNDPSVPLPKLEQGLYAIKLTAGPEVTQSSTSEAPQYSMAAVVSGDSAIPLTPHARSDHVLVFSDAAIWKKSLSSDSPVDAPVFTAEERQLSLVAELLGPQVKSRISYFIPVMDIGGRVPPEQFGFVKLHNKNRADMEGPHNITPVSSTFKDFTLSSFRTQKHKADESTDHSSAAADWSSWTPDPAVYNVKFEQVLTTSSELPEKVIQATPADLSVGTQQHLPAQHQNNIPASPQDAEDSSASAIPQTHSHALPAPTARSASDTTTAHVTQELHEAHARIPSQQVHSHSGPSYSQGGVTSAAPAHMLQNKSELHIAVMPGRAAILNSHTVNPSTLNSVQYATLTRPGEETVTELPIYRYHFDTNTKQLLGYDATLITLRIPEHYHFLKVVPNISDGVKTYNLAFCNENGEVISQGNFVVDYRPKPSVHAMDARHTATSGALPEMARNVLVRLDSGESNQEILQNLYATQGDTPVYKILMNGSVAEVQEYTGGKKVGVLNGESVYFSTSIDQPNTYLLHYNDTQIPAPWVPTSLSETSPSGEEIKTFLVVSQQGLSLRRAAGNLGADKFIAKSAEDVKTIASEIEKLIQGQELSITNPIWAELLITPRNTPQVVLAGGAGHSGPVAMELRIPSGDLFFYQDNFSFAYKPRGSHIGILLASDVDSMAGTRHLSVSPLLHNDGRVHESVLTLDGKKIAEHSRLLDELLRQDSPVESLDATVTPNPEIIGVTSGPNTQQNPTPEAPAKPESPVHTLPKAESLTADVPVDQLSGAPAPVVPEPKPAPAKPEITVQPLPKTEILPAEVPGDKLPSAPALAVQEQQPAPVVPAKPESPVQPLPKTEKLPADVQGDKTTGAISSTVQEQQPVQSTGDSSTPTPPATPPVQRTTPVQPITPAQTPEPQNIDLPGTENDQNTQKDPTPAQVTSKTLSLRLGEKICTDPESGKSIFIARVHASPEWASDLMMPLPKYVSTSNGVLFLQANNDYVYHLAPQHRYLQVSHIGGQYTLSACNAERSSLQPHEFTDNLKHCSNAVCSLVESRRKSYDALLKSQKLDLDLKNSLVSGQEITQEDLRAAYDMHTITPPLKITSVNHLAPYVALEIYDTSQGRNNYSHTNEKLGTQYVIFEVDNDYKTCHLLQGNGGPSDAQLRFDFDRSHTQSMAMARKMALVEHPLYIITDGESIFFSSSLHDAEPVYDLKQSKTLLKSALFHERAVHNPPEKFYALRVTTTEHFDTHLGTSLQGIGVITNNGVIDIPTLSNDTNTILGFDSDQLFKIIHKDSRTFARISHKQLPDLQHKVLQKFIENNAKLEIQYDTGSFVTTGVRFHGDNKVIRGPASIISNIVEMNSHDAGNSEKQFLKRLDDHTPPPEESQADVLHIPLTWDQTEIQQHYDSPHKVMPSDAPYKLFSQLPLYIDEAERHKVSETKNVSDYPFMVQVNDRNIPLPHTAYYFKDAKVSILDLMDQTPKEVSPSMHYLKVLQNKNDGSFSLAFCDKDGKEIPNVPHVDAASILLNIPSYHWNLSRLHDSTNGKAAFTLMPSANNTASAVNLLPTEENYLSQLGFAHKHVARLSTDSAVLSHNSSTIGITYHNFADNIEPVREIMLDMFPERSNPLYRLALQDACNAHPLYMVIQNNKVALTLDKDSSNLTFKEDDTLLQWLQTVVQFPKSDTKFSLMLTFSDELKGYKSWIPFVVTPTDKSVKTLNHAEVNKNSFLYFDPSDYSISFYDNTTNAPTALVTSSEWLDKMLSTATPILFKLDVLQGARESDTIYKLAGGKDNPIVAADLGKLVEQQLSMMELLPEQQMPETPQPETPQPETPQPETLQPETLQPETLPSDVYTTTSPISNPTTESKDTSTLSEPQKTTPTHEADIDIGTAPISPDPVILKPSEAPKTPDVNLDTIDTQKQNLQHTDEDADKDRDPVSTVNPEEAVVPTAPKGPGTEDAPKDPTKAYAGDTISTQTSPLWVKATYDDIQAFYTNLNTKYENRELSYHEAMTLYNSVIQESCGGEAFRVPGGTVDDAGNVTIGNFSYGSITDFDNLFNI